MTSTALFSKCGKYRYWLYRSWDPERKTAACIGLNPSTANGEKNDPTIESLIRLMKHNGYGAFFMLNLFALISPNPEDLRSCADPLSANDKHLSSFKESDADIIFCWGRFPMAEYRAKVVRKMFPNALCFGKNQDGSPKHPLYLKATTKTTSY